MCNANIFRTLLPDEIEVRVQQVTNTKLKKAILLLYKNARIDMDLLDEKFGCLGWQREHNFKDGKNYCKVSVYDKDKQMWVSKEDVGIESKTEETKGEASDSFKRACVNLGIGRELYSAPSIVIEINDDEWTMNERTNKPAINSWIKFRVAEILYNTQRKITDLMIVDSKNNVRYQMKGTPIATVQSKPQQTINRKPLTMDDLMDEDKLNKLSLWVHNKVANGGKIEDIINTYYTCDADTLDKFKSIYSLHYGR